MEEKFIGKWHIIFYRNYERYILPSVVYVPKTISSCAVLTLVWLRWRITIYSNTEDAKIRDYNGKMRNFVKVALTDVSEQRFKDYQTSLRDIIDWIDSFFHPAY